MTPRHATLDDLRMILGWAAAEGWNPGLDDAGAFHAADPRGFFVTESGGQPIAAISVVNHSADFAFLGLYLCRPEWRGRGIGLALWLHAMAHAGTRTVGLDGVAAQEENYARSGFVRAGATVRFAGPSLPGDAAAARDAGPADTDTLLALDQSANGVARPAFLRAWTAQSADRRTVVAEGIRGFATIRRCREGVKIGPLIAPDVVSAVALMRAALARLPADRVFIDLPDGAGPLAHLLHADGYVPVFETARMYRGTPPPVSPALQAIATMELG